MSVATSGSFALSRIRRTWRLVVHCPFRVSNSFHSNHRKAGNVTQTFSQRTARAVSVAVMLLAGLPLLAQEGVKNGEWPNYSGDKGSTRYSPLDQINANNFNKLEVAWRF